MTELAPAEKARIASQAQAEAHRALRRRHPEEYKTEYQAAKTRLSDPGLEEDLRLIRKANDDDHDQEASHG